MIYFIGVFLLRANRLAGLWVVQRPRLGLHAVARVQVDGLALEEARVILLREVDHTRRHRVHAKFTNLRQQRVGEELHEEQPVGNHRLRERLHRVVLLPRAEVALRRDHPLDESLHVGVERVALEVRRRKLDETVEHRAGQTHRQRSRQNPLIERGDRVARIAKHTRNLLRHRVHRVHDDTRKRIDAAIGLNDSSKLLTFQNSGGNL